MSRRRGNVIVLSAPSGAGKSTVLQELFRTVTGLEFSVSYTTRPPRPDERDGLEYHFVSETEFRAKITRNEFLEWANVHGNLYGTGQLETDAVCTKGTDILLDVDVQGAEQIRRTRPEAVHIFMLPPSFQVLEERLRGRGTDDLGAIERRLADARSEATRYHDYDYVIVNHDIPTTAELLRSIVVAERARPRVMGEVIQSILQTFR